jgi:Lrp/AsnC family leucine-responsive transcriptional regulator
MIDNLDLKILNIIQSHGRMSNAELARKLNMAPSGILERVRRLEKKGVITGYEVRLDAAKLGITITAFIHVLSSDTVGSTEVGKALATIPEVLEVHWIAGDYNYLVKTRLKNGFDLTALLKKFGQIDGLRDTRTTLVLETIKESQAIPVGQLDHHLNGRTRMQEDTSDNLSR